MQRDLTERERKREGRGEEERGRERERGGGRERERKSDLTERVNSPRLVLLSLSR